MELTDPIKKGSQTNKEVLSNWSQTHGQAGINEYTNSKYYKLLQKEADAIRNEPGPANHYGDTFKYPNYPPSLGEHIHGTFIRDNPDLAKPSGISYKECLCKATERPLTPFEAVVKEITLLHEKKSSDYGTGEDPYANIRGTQEFGIQPWVGAIVRAADKIVRLKQYIKRGRLVNESVEDSLLDLATYAIIALVMYRENND